MESDPIQSIEQPNDIDKLDKLETDFSKNTKKYPPKNYTKHSGVIKTICVSAGMIFKTYFGMLINLFCMFVNSFYKTDLFNIILSNCFLRYLHIRWWINHLKEKNVLVLKEPSLQDLKDSIDCDDLKKTVKAIYQESMSSFMDRFPAKDSVS